MSGRVTLTLDTAEDLFYLALVELEKPDARPLDQNQIDALYNLADKIDFQRGSTICRTSLLEACR